MLLKGKVTYLRGLEGRGRGRQGEEGSGGEEGGYEKRGEEMGEGGTVVGLRVMKEGGMDGRR